MTEEVLRQRIQSVARYVLRLTLLAAAFYISARAGLLLAIPPSTAAPVWPAAGVALAGLVVWSARYWPGVFLGSLAVNLHIGAAGLGWDAIAAAAPVALAMAIGPTVQALIGARLLARFGLQGSPLEDVRDIVQILLLGGALASCFSALYSPAVLCLYGIAPWEAYFGQVFIWWVGDVIGVVLVTPALMLFGVRGVRPERSLAVSAGLIAIFSLSAIVFFQAKKFEDRERRYQLEELADNMVADLRSRVVTVETILRSIGGLIKASDEVTPHDFDNFVAPFFRAHDEIHALSILTRVDGPDRAAYEQAIREGGAPGFTITQRVEGGGLGPATERDVYFPIHLTEPRESRQKVLGFDVSAPNPATGDLRRKVLDLARDTATLQSSGQVRLVSVADTSGMVFFMPIYRGAGAPQTIEERRDRLIGYATSLLLTDGAMAPLLQKAGRRGVNLTIRDLDASRSLQMLAQSDDAAREPVADARRSSGVSRVIDFAGRMLEIHVVERPDAAMSRTPRVLWYVLIGGVLLTGLSGVFILVLTARTAVVERLVEARTLALREREARFNAIISNSADGVLTVDDRGMVESYNPACERIFGYREGEVEGQPIELLIARVDGQPLGGVYVGADLVGRRKRGGRFDIEISAGGFNLSGRRHVTLIIRDVTERRRAEKEREALMSRLRRSNEELERFAFVASHDLQEPLRKIAMFSDMVRNRVDDGVDEKSRGHLERINSAALRMKELIHDLLAYSKASSLSLSVKPMQVVELLAEAREMVASSLEEAGARIEIEGDANIVGDRFLMRQALQNLLSNAVKYRSDKTLVIRVTAEMRGEVCRLSVADNGMGFEPEFAERIFHVFERLHRKEDIPGTGVGLAVCDRVARRHGGRIWAEATPGEGAVFTIEWPVEAHGEDQAIELADLAS